MLNLSQAVLLASWELARARGALRDEDGPRRPPAAVATLHERRELREDMSQLLAELGYGPPRAGSLHRRILRRLLGMVERSGGERDDVSMLRGLARAVRRRAGLPRKRAAGRPP